MLVGIDNLGGILRRENCVTRRIYMLRASGAWVFQFSDWVRWAHTVRLRKSAERMKKRVEIVWVGFAANGGSLPSVRAMSPTLPQQKEFSIF
jgi:hypothetical protein